MRYALLMLLLAAPAHGACFADYKAKRDDPLNLHYGVARVTEPCDAASAAKQLAPRLRDAGWQLLTVVSVFDQSGLNERESRAGDFYLRF